MSALVIPLASVRRHDVGRVGGKAAMLGSLHEAGFPVPAGLCLTTAAFAAALEPYRSQLTGLLRDDLRRPETAQATAQAIAATLADLAIPEAVSEVLRQALPAVTGPDEFLAVRSSATAEDRADTSFAGQYETVLGVRGEAELLAAIVACWRSFFSAHALTARAAAGALHGDDAMAVLVQRLVDAECAGVCFSVDPVRQRRETILIEAAWGLGLGAVDGSVAADSYRLHRATFDIDERHIVEKSEQIALDSAGGLRHVPTPPAACPAACLPDAWAKRVAQFAIAAEVALGAPQDIEWAIADGQVWLLQSRPITTLPADLCVTYPPVAWADDRERRSLWQLEPWVGGRPRLPLDREVADTQYAARAEAALIKGDERVEQSRVFYGRRYLSALPSPLREGDRRVRQAAFRALIERVGEQGLPMWEHWAPEVVAATRRLSTFDVARADGPALADHLEDAFGALLRHWTIHWQQHSGDLLIPTIAAVSGLSGPAAEVLAAHLSDGEETIFTQLVDGLYELAQAARSEPTVAALVVAPPADVLDRLAAMPEAVAFRARLEAFLTEYGDRSGTGFGSGGSIMRPTWREQPALVLALVAPYLDPAVESPAAARARARAERDAQVETVCAACPDATAVADFRRRLPLLRRSRTALENHNHYIDQMSYGQLRRAILAAARWLTSQGAIAAVDDIFWLERDEIVVALRAPASLAATIAARRAEHATWAAIDPPPLLGAAAAQLDPRPSLTDAVTSVPVEENGRIVGQGASAGRRRGRARVVAMGTLMPALAPGDVLIAENAGPLWTPFFPILAGLVLDQGLVMQHAATTAREYGIPAVIATGNATRRIPDGAWVTVDGAFGTVEVEEATGDQAAAGAGG
jgi:pyruvate,water dikinase